MSFVYAKYSLVAVGTILILCFVFFNQRRKFLNLVRDYWFVKSSFTSTFSFITFMFGICFLIVALLDLRGAEEKISATIPDQKTIIMIDTSASMLADDVRPNRFEKALWMARHFVKKAAGHQISVVLFSDIQKQIVPFTDDIDLLEARLEGLKSLTLNYGGSNIKQALSEIPIYFKNSQEQTKFGNVLLFTDGEEGGESYNVKGTEGLTLAVVGIGTARGAKIPLRNRDNRFIGYKKYKGKEVVTKLNEKFFKNLGAGFNDYRYWIAQSYTIPTEEILSFFRENFKKSSVKGEISVKPVFGYILIKIGLVLISLAMLLRYFKAFTYIMIACLFILSSPQDIYAQEKQKHEKKIPKELIEKIEKYKKYLREKRLDKSQRLKLAQLLLLAQQYKQSKIMYDENGIDDIDEPLIRYNYALSLAMNKQIQPALSILKELSETYQNNLEFIKLIRSSVLALLQQQKRDQQQKQQKQQQQKNNKDQKKNKKDQKNSQNKDKKESQKQDKKNEQSENKKQNNNNDQNKDQKQNEKENNDINKDKKEKKKDSKQKQDDKQNKNKKEKKNKPQSLKQKEEEIRKKRRMTKVPTILKKIMNDDRKLQERYLDTRTDKRERKQQDW